MFVSLPVVIRGKVKREVGSGESVLGLLLTHGAADKGWGSTFLRLSLHIFQSLSEETLQHRTSADTPTYFPKSPGEVQFCPSLRRKKTGESHKEKCQEKKGREWNRFDLKQWCCWLLRNPDIFYINTHVFTPFNFSPNCSKHPVWKTLTAYVR